jgi:3-hydroxybutyryl-CoA dehydratase
MEPMTVLADVPLGTSVKVTKTIGESDVYLFAGLTGDLHPNHVDETYMAAGRYGRRVAHGVLLVGFMSAASSKFLLDHQIDGVSYGYDRVRFVKPAYIGDTITVTYTLEDISAEDSKSRAKVEVTRADGELVAVATHILKFIR